MSMYVFDHLNNNEEYIIKSMARQFEGLSSAKPITTIKCSLTTKLPDHSTVPELPKDDIKFWNEY